MMNQGGSRTRHNREKGRDKGRDLRNLVGMLMGVGAATTATAQTAITIDSSFGRTPGQIAVTATNTTVTGNRGATYNVNNLYTIAESQGRVAGANLFHSFGTFNVGAGDAAVFTTTTASLSNIIARVSGPSASTIEGLLAVNAAATSAPNLFFINPAGVTFGTGAQVDVPGAFHVSTANELRFADGTTFKAGTGPDSSMTMAAPEAFGFVGGSGNIAFNGIQTDVQFPDRPTPFVASRFDLTAASVTFVDSNISVPQAAVRIVGVGAAASNIPIEGAPTTAAQGDVRLTRSTIDVSPDPNADLLEDFPTDDFPTEDFPTGDFPVDDFPMDDFPAGDLPMDDFPSEIPSDDFPEPAPQAFDAGNILLLGRDVVLEESDLVASDGFQSSGSAGFLRIRAAGDVTLDRANLTANIFGDFADTNFDTNFRAGSIDIFAEGAINAQSAVLSISTNSPDFAVAPSSGILLQGQSVSLLDTTVDAQSFDFGIPDVVAAPVSIVSGSTITLDTTSVQVDSGTTVNRRAGDLTLRSLGGGDIVIRSSGLTSDGFVFGGSGTVQIDTTGNVLLFDTIVSSEGLGSKGGAISIRGNEITLDGEIGSVISGDAFAVDFIDTLPGVGSITLDATSRVFIGSTSSISARSSGTIADSQVVQPGEVRIRTPRLQLDGQINTVTVGDIGASNIVIDGGDSGLTVTGAGTAVSSSEPDDDSFISNPSTEPAQGDAGAILLLGENIDVSGVQLRSTSDTGSQGDAGSIQILAANQLTISGAQLQTDTSGSGKAGNITLSSRIGSIDSSQISSRAAPGTASAAGLETIASGQTGTIALSASQSLGITNTTVSIANDVSVADPSLLTPGTITVSAPTLTLANSSITAESSQNVIASAITVNAAAGLTLDTASISSSAKGTAAAGDIAINSNGTVALTDSSITGDALAAKTSQLTVSGTQVVLDGTSRLSTSLLGGPTTTTGGVGAIRVAGTDSIVLGANSSIDARTVGSFDNPDQATPGEVRLTTPRLDVAGTITTETLGNVAASNIVITSSGQLAVAGTGVLTSSTSGSGNAGNVDISGNDTSITGVMVNSASASGSSGSAGTVTLSAADDLSVVDSVVRTDTAGSGKAGNIALTARTITIAPSLISSQAASGSSGQTGTIDVTASNAVELRDSTVSIANAARVAEPSMTPLGRIRIGAPVVKLLNSNVTAQSSENVAASAIAVDAPNSLSIRNSNVTTSAQDGDGGRIDVRGQRFTLLDKSQISTSVLGTQSGSGGDITVRANVMVVRNGFVQANTAAQGASGGNVVLAVGQLLPVGALVTGGDVPLLFDPQRNGINAIQAAAPDGVAGTIQVAGPTLDVVGDLQRVEAEFVATGPLGQDLCKRGNASSLTQLGRGGLRPLSSGLVRPETSLPLLPELPKLSLRLDSQVPSTAKCGS